MNPVEMSNTDSRTCVLLIQTWILSVANAGARAILSVPTAASVFLK